MIVQTVIIYGSEIWLVIGAILEVLEGFQHILVRWIIGMADQMEEDRD